MEGPDRPANLGCERLEGRSEPDGANLGLADQGGELRGEGRACRGVGGDICGDVGGDLAVFKYGLGDWKMVAQAKSLQRGSSCTEPCTNIVLRDWSWCGLLGGWFELWMIGRLVLFWLKGFISARLPVVLQVVVEVGCLAETHGIMKQACPL